MMSSLPWLNWQVAIEQPGTDAIEHHIGKEPGRAGIIMPLQVAADLVAAIADAGRLLRRGGIKQQARRFHRAATEDDHIGRQGLSLPVGVNNRDAGDAPAGAACQPLRHHLRP